MRLNGHKRPSQRTTPRVPTPEQYDTDREVRQVAIWLLLSLAFVCSLILVVDLLEHWGLL